MGQKANLNTVRKFFKNINLLTSSSKVFLTGFNFLNSFNRFCNIKNIIVVTPTLNFIGSKAVLNLLFFIRTAKLKKTIKQIKKLKNLKKIKNCI